MEGTRRAEITQIVSFSLHTIVIILYHFFLPAITLMWFVLFSRYGESAEKL